MFYDQILLNAVDEADVPAIKRALENKSDPNTQTADGLYVLHIAAWRGHVEIVKLLLDAGADPNVRDKSLGRTPLHRSSCISVVDLLMQAGADMNARMRENGNTRLHDGLLETSVIELMVRGGADCNAKNAISWTPLHAHAAMGNPEAVALLLALGADVGIQDNFGSTPLDIARWRNDAKIASQIESHVLKSSVRATRSRGPGGLGL